MNSKKSTDKRHLYFLAILVFSNIISFQLGSIPPEIHQEKTSFVREGYEAVQIQAKSIVPFSAMKRVHIKIDGHISAHGFLLDYLPETETYIVYCPKIFIEKFTADQEFVLVPFIENVAIHKPKTTRRRAYEISIP